MRSMSRLRAPLYSMKLNLSQEKSVWLELQKLEREDVAAKKADATRRRMATRKVTMEEKTKKKVARKATMLTGKMEAKMRAAEEENEAAEKGSVKGGKKAKGEKGKRVGRSK